MRLKSIIRSVLIIGLLAGGLTTTALAKDKEKLEAKAKITKAQAEKIIHKLWREGKIQSSELEEENGKLVWSFDIALREDNDIIEAQVDARTGKVVSVEIERPADQKKEAKIEGKEGKGKKQLKKSEKEDEDDKDAKESKKEGKKNKEHKKGKKDKGHEEDDDDKDEKK